MLNGRKRKTKVRNLSAIGVNNKDNLINVIQKHLNIYKIN